MFWLFGDAAAYAMVEGVCDDEDNSPAEIQPHLSGQHNGAGICDVGV